MTDWHVIQSPTDTEMYAVMGVYLVADQLPIEDARLIAAASHLLLELERLVRKAAKAYNECEEITSSCLAIALATGE